MPLRSTILALGAAALLWAADGGAAIGARYRLDPRSELQTGCFPPCMCPVLIRSPIEGTFTLVPAGFDGLYQHYDVREVDWLVPGAAGSARVTGSGRYRVGGEVAVQHQMVLDLAADGRAVRTYDSGLVPGGGGFPGIEVDAALHAFFCHDSVFSLAAKPAVAGIGGSASAERLRLGPNPFDAATQIGFVLGEEAPVWVSVLELSGRRIRTLASGERRAPGPQSLAWDGTRDDGSRVAAGLYFVVVRAAGREMRGMLVRVAPRR